MSEAAMGEATQVQEATETAGKQFAGKSEVKEVKEAGPDLSKMTGAEAKAYVESLKQKEAKTKGDIKSPVKEAAQEATEKIVEPKKKYKVKVDGAEEEVDEDELLRGYSHQKAANKILQEGKAARKQAEEFISMMKDPQKFFDAARKMGYDDKQIREMAESKLATYLQDEMMDPRDRELRDTKDKLRQIEENERLQKEQLERHRHEVLKKKFAQDYEVQFTTALKESSLPPTKETVAQMAKYIQRSAKIGFQMTAKEAAQLVKEDLQLLLQRVTSEADGETLVKILGDNIPNKLREYDTKKLRSPEQHLKTPEVQGQPRKREAPHKRMTPKEWRDFNRK